MTLAWGDVFILVLLDVSVAFHTISHSILLDWLWGLGVGNSVLQQFSSFLHYQSVLVGEERPSPRHLLCGALQHSSLFPLLFNIYQATGRGHVSCWKNRWQLWTGRPLHNSVLCTNCTHFWTRKPCSNHTPFGLLQCALCKDALEEHLKAAIGPECSGMHSFVCLQFTWVIELHLLSLAF